MCVLSGAMIAVAVPYLTFTGSMPAASAASATTPAPGGPGVPRIPGRSARGPFYLAIGASESLGVEPKPPARLDNGHRGARVDPHGGRPTDHGYANDLVRMESTRWPHLHLVQYGCSGITLQAALYGGATCGYPSGSEMATAEHFLRAHRDGSVLATVDLGYNDLWPCLVHRALDPSCVAGAMSTIRHDMPILLAQLRAAGGRHLLVVGLEHNDPFLAAWLHGRGGAAFADATLGVFKRFNGLLGQLYRRGGARVADVAAAWRSADRHRVHLGGHGDVPADVAEVCTQSWACASRNVHPNAGGYRVIADAVAAALGSRPATGAGRTTGVSPSG